MVKTYDDFSASTKLESFVDYSKTKENTIEKISNLTEKETIEIEDIEEKENNIFFKGCMCGMLVAFVIMLFMMNFIKEMI